MIVCKELGKEFGTKEELFKALKSSKDRIINIKKKTILTGYNANNPEESKQVVLNNQTKLKSLVTGANKALFSDDNYYYFAVNTTKILDSHRDLHDDGMWNKSAKEQSGKNYLADTHSLTIKDTIAYPEDVEIFVAEIPFKSLGYKYKGNTEALVYKVHKDNIRGDKVRKDLEDGKTMQASVKMQYVKIELAMNSDSEEDVEEKKVYDENKNKIANKEDFKEEIHYFFLVKEAKNIHESSLVPFGSNHVTGRLESQKNIEPPKSTQLNKEQAAESTWDETFYKHLNPI
jgi:hypothetical protein